MKIPLSYNLSVLIFANAPIYPTENKGTGNWVNTLLEELKRYDELKFTVVFYDKKVDKIEYEDHNLWKFIKIPHPSASNRIKKILSNWSVLDEFKNVTDLYLKIVNKVNPDIIQIFGLESPFVRIIGKTRQPIVTHIQGLLGPYLLKYFSRYKYLELIRARGIRSVLTGDIPGISKKRISNHLKIEDEVYGKIEYCLGRTDWDRRCLRALAPDAKYYYCQEIMRTPFYQVRWKPTQNKKHIFYTTIRDVFYKNVDIIYETCNLLNKYNQKLNYEWRVAGVSEEDITPKIMKQRNLNCSNIILLGRLDANDLVRELLNADIFIYPAAMENSCNSVQEAMLTGIPIISSYAGGLSSVIQDKCTGYLVNEGDPYVMAGAIIETLEDYTHAVSMGQSAREIALTRHEPSSVAETLITIYNNILNERIQPENTLRA